MLNALFKVNLFDLIERILICDYDKIPQLKISGEQMIQLDTIFVHPKCFISREKAAI